MLKVGGIWVSPVEVENAAGRACGRTRLRRRRREDRDGLVKPMAFTSSCAGMRPVPSSAELQQFVRERLAEYKRPRWVEFLSELPKTATGKIQRFKLARPRRGRS